MDSTTASSAYLSSTENEKVVNSQKEIVSTDALSVVQSAQPVYRVYKQRWLALAALVCLNLVAALGQPWFGPISNDGAFTSSLPALLALLITISSGQTV